MSLAKPVSPILQRGRTLVRGLVLAWLLYENSGKSVYDLSGNGYTGTFDGAWNGGPSGAAAHTDGSSTQIVLTRTSGQASPNIQSGDFSIALRFRVTTLGSYIPIFDCFDNSSLFRLYSLFLNAGSGASSVFWSAGGSGTAGTDNINIGTTIAVNTWYDLVVTRRGTLSSFYINGNLGGTNSGETSTNSSTTSTRTLSLGANPSGSGTKEPATYDYFTLWNRALSAGEVAQFNFDPFDNYRVRSHWWEVPAAAGAFTNRPGPRMGPAIPFGLAIGGAKLLERNPIIHRRELFGFQRNSASGD